MLLIKQSLIVLLLQILTQLALARDPTPFNENVLPVGQRNGEFIENLGHLIKIETHFQHKDVDKLPAKFSIYRRTRSSPEIEFKPNKFCYGSGSTCNFFHYDLLHLSGSGFDPELKTVIIVPGFQSDDDNDWMDLMRDRLLQLEDINVILVSWKSGAKTPLYHAAAAATPLIARQITILLHHLADLNGYELTDEAFTRRLHFVGHSLGAHIAGYVGQDLGGKMGRITGLDPAGPSFDYRDPEHRLDRTDAQLVDVIHTNSGKIHYEKAIESGLLNALYAGIKKIPMIGRLAGSVEQEVFNYNADTAWYGIDKQIGHLDYYANNGRVQPGCNDLMHICDHGRAHAIFNDILGYLIALEMSSSERRIMAFGANDYEDFSAGASIKRGEQVVPLDLLAPADKFIDELRTDFGLDVSRSDNQRKYFFKTNSEKPLVAEHHLLNVRLHHLDFWDASICSLQVELRMRNGLKTELELASFSGLEFAIPFAHVNGAESRNALNEILHQHNSNGTSDYDSLYKVVPMQIVFKIKGRYVDESPKEVPVREFKKQRKPRGWNPVTSLIGGAKAVANKVYNSLPEWGSKTGAKEKPATESTLTRWTNKAKNLFGYGTKPDSARVQDYNFIIPEWKDKPEQKQVLCQLPLELVELAPLDHEVNLVTVYSNSYTQGEAEIRAFTEENKNSAREKGSKVIFGLGEGTSAVYNIDTLLV